MKQSGLSKDRSKAASLGAGESAHYRVICSGAEVVARSDALLFLDLRRIARCAHPSLRGKDIDYAQHHEQKSHFALAFGQSKARKFMSDGW